MVSVEPIECVIEPVPPTLDRGRGPLRLRRRSPAEELSVVWRIISALRRGRWFRFVRAKSTSISCTISLRARKMRSNRLRSGASAADGMSKYDATRSTCSLDCRLCEIRSSTSSLTSTSLGSRLARTEDRKLGSSVFCRASRLEMNVLRFSSAPLDRSMVSDRASRTSCLIIESRPAPANTNIARSRFCSSSVGVPFALRVSLVASKISRKEDAAS